jgi:DNA processing protein
MGNNANSIDISNPDYPSLLKEAGKPPEVLRYKGDWCSDIFERCLTVVGARKMTKYGREVTRKIVQEIASAGITIVSGFMYGIDATAHKAALEAGGRTIAVMPCGVDIVHPGHQKGLYEEIINQNGLIISEYEDKHPPCLWTYPQRNKIMAGISLATLVIEAGPGSGSLITAKAAKAYKRRLFALPGPVTSIVSQGSLQLIKEGCRPHRSRHQLLYDQKEQEQVLYPIPLHRQKVHPCLRILYP